jgi:hypothetical protein
MTIRDQIESVCRDLLQKRNRSRAIYLLTQYDSWNRLASSKGERLRKIAEHERLDVEREMQALLMNLEAECGK